VDGQGAALLVATAADGTVFGGYNPKGWLGYGEWWGLRTKSKSSWTHLIQCTLLSQTHPVYSLFLKAPGDPTLEPGTRYPGFKVVLSN
jgi:hypothetical protein